MLLMSLSTSEVADCDDDAVSESLNDVFGRRLRAHRKDLGMSQEAFAEHLGVHRTYVGALERGERNITLGSLSNFARLLGVDPIELLTDPQAKQRAVRKKRGAQKK